MKKLLFIVSLAVASAATASVRDGAADFDRTASEAAARIVLESLADDLLSAPPKDHALRDAMLADPASHVDPASSRAVLSGAFTNALAARYADEAARVLARLAGARETRTAFTGAFVSEAVTLPPARLASAATALYPGAFATARREACAAQAATLAASVRPTEAEVDTQARGTLRETLTGRIAAAQKTAVFQENLVYISGKLVDPMLDDALAQRGEQAASLRRARPAGWAPEVVESNLVAALCAEVAARRAAADAAHPAYGVFPSLTNAVARSRAETCVLERFTDRVADAAMPVDADSVLREIERDPSRHVRRSDSLKAFAPVFRRRVLDAAFASASAAAPAAERGAFDAFIRAREQSAPVAAAVTRRVDKDLLPAVGEVRAACAARQFAKTWPALSDGTWCPDAELADRVCDKPDYKTAVARWRSMEGLEELAAADRGRPVMEETAALADRKVAAAFDLARSARTAQTGLIDGLYPAVLQACRAAAAGGRKPALKDVVADYTGRAEKGWDAARSEVLWKGAPEASRPKNADEQYVGLFPSARRRIELLAKSVMEALKEEKPETPIPPAPTPPPETLPVRDMSCVISLSRRGGDITFDLSVDGADRGAFTCPSSPNRYASAAPKTIKKTADALAGQVREAIKTNRIALRVDILVKDGFVYYGTVRALADAIQSCAMSFGSAVPSCDIGDSLVP